MVWQEEVVCREESGIGMGAGEGEGGGGGGREVGGRGGMLICDV